VKKLGLAIAPVVLGLATALIWQAGWLPNEILYLRADVGTTFLGLGIALSLALMCGIVIHQWSRRGVQHAIEHARTQEIAAHRRFIRRLDHEIKNPLTAIRAALANLDGRDDNPTLASVRAQVDRLAKLGTDLRKLTDLETLLLEKEHVDPGQLLTELVLLVRERPDAACCELHLTLPGEPPDLLHPPPGCRFHPRCVCATSICAQEVPPFKAIDNRHSVACWHPMGGN